LSFYRIDELHPNELEERLAEQPVLVLPVGTIEWHSHHLPLGLDSLLAEEICTRIAGRLSAVLAPAGYWAVGGVPYPYTLDLPQEPVEWLYEVALAQFAKMGFRVILAFSGHFGLAQTLALKRAACKAMQACRDMQGCKDMQACRDMQGCPAAILPLTEYDLTTDLGYDGDHAALGETSLLLAVRPDLVRLEAVAAEAPLEGIIGEDPRGRASAARGAQLLEAIVERAAQMVQRFCATDGLAQQPAYLAALEAGVRVLEEIQRQRQALSKAGAAPITTPLYRQYCQALAAGNYEQALAFAIRKLQDPTQ
jgi:creatinine amidohydrolase